MSGPFPDNRVYSRRALMTAQSESLRLQLVGAMLAGFIAGVLTVGFVIFAVLSAEAIP